MNFISQNHSDILPCVVIGAGVAGHAAMVWLESFGVPATWIANSSEVGGMLQRVHNVLVNVPGQNYPHGQALASAINAQLERSKISPPTVAQVTHIHDRGEHFTLDLDGQASLHARTILLATGTRYGSLSFPGQHPDSPHITTTDSAYFSESAAHDGDRFAGKSVAVVGGGDAAFENAITLAKKHGCTVHLMMRSTPKARRKFASRVIELHDKIHVWPIPTTIDSVQEHQDHITLNLDTSHTQHMLDVSCVFIRIGVRPVLPKLMGFKLDTNHAGYLRIDDTQRTSHPRILAAGDITHTAMQSIVTSASEAAKAALTLAEELGAYTLSEDELAQLINPPTTE